MRPGTLVYDGDCTFCERSVRWMQRRSHATAVALSSHAADLPRLGLDEEDCQRAVQWVGPTGASEGAEALRSYVATGTVWARALAWVVVNPATRPMTRRAYELVAENRHRLGPSGCQVPAARTQGAPTLRR